MKLSKYFSNAFTVALILLGLSGALFVSKKSEKPTLFVTKQQSSLNLDNNFLQFFHLGQKRLFSSLFWISTILESDHDHYKARDLNSWMFLRFLTISNLEPKFLMTYTFGGVYLSIIKDDIPGASVIFNKGLNYYPTDYYLLRDATYHFFYEAKDNVRAYQLANIIKIKFPDKHALVGMTSKLEAEYGTLEESLRMLDEYQKIHLKGSFLGDRVFSNRYALKAEIDLNCLNYSKVNNCSKYDLNNVPYLKIKDKFIAQTAWAPYRRKK